jgi:hypothetical protein
MPSLSESSLTSTFKKTDRISISHQQTEGQASICLTK